MTKSVTSSPSYCFRVRRVHFTLTHSSTPQVVTFSRHTAEKSASISGWDDSVTMHTSTPKYCEVVLSSEIDPVTYDRAGVHVQMFRSSGQSDEKPPVFCSQESLVLIDRPTEGMKGLVDLAQPGIRTGELSHWVSYSE
ncbi:hypothetical protein TNCV_2548501 [Trichonephila clavipes]|nr:hypothetical protein TNCV_2548501 [Trichonephila clavipes]